MTPPGAVQFDELAARNYQRQVALDYDGVVVSAPQINAQQFNGRGQITGALGEQEAKDVAAVLRSGSLPRLLIVGSVDDQPPTTITAAPEPRSTLAPTTTGPPATARCPRTDGSEARTTRFQASPPPCINPAKRYTATLKTSEGTMVIALNTQKAPIAVNNFVSLARYHFYDGLTFHRVVRDFVIQGGDPRGDGTGGPGYTFKDELPGRGEYKIGSVAMANSGPDTNGSQFFTITGQQGVQLPPNYSLFGEVTSGLDVAQRIEALADPGDPSQKPSRPVTIDSVTITEA